MDNDSRRSVLFVDDEPEVVTSLRSLFRRKYDVHTATGAEEGLAKLRSATVHVVISDQRMPGMSGAEFLAKVAEHDPDIVRVMMTGYSDIDSVIDAINRGHVYRYISKPWDPIEMEAVVAQAVEIYDLVADRRRLLRDLEEANRLKTTFITIASHELNTPLTIVMGMLQLALTRNEEPSTEEYLLRAQKAAERLHQRLTNTFKLVQSKEFEARPARSQVRLSDFLAEIRQELEPFLKIRKQRILLQVEPRDLEISTSPPHLRDIFEALLGNAIKFSPDLATLRVGASVSQGTVLIRVTDEGSGIHENDQPHIFEPFFSTWDAMHHSTGDYGFGKRGMGLGLPIARRFAEMIGGRLDFESTERGSTFRLELPVE